MQGEREIVPFSPTKNLKVTKWLQFPTLICDDLLKEGKNICRIHGKSQKINPVFILCS